MAKGHLSFGFFTSWFFLSVQLGVPGVWAWCLFCVTLGSSELGVMHCKGVLCCFGTEENFPGFSFAFAVEEVRLLRMNSQTNLGRLLL